MSLAFLGAALPAAADSFECLIEPNQIVELRSPVEGVIENILVKRGDRVRTGQVLVQLESRAEQSANELARYRAQMAGRLASSRNRLDYANKKLARATELEREKFVAPQVRDEAEAEKRIAESELRDAVENQELAGYEHRHSTDLLSRRTLRSPFDGVVMERLLNPGDLAEAETGRKPVLKLAQIEPLRVEVVLPLAAHGKLRAGAIADVVPEGIGGHYVATVAIVDSVFDTASGTVGVRLQMANPKGLLPAGIRCRVDFPQVKGSIASKLVRPTGAP